MGEGGPSRWGGVLPGRGGVLPSGGKEVGGSPFRGGDKRERRRGG